MCWASKYPPCWWSTHSAHQVTPSALGGPVPNGTALLAMKTSLWCLVAGSSSPSMALHGNALEMFHVFGREYNLSQVMGLRGRGMASYRQMLSWSSRADWVKKNCILLPTWHVFHFMGKSSNCIKIPQSDSTWLCLDTAGKNNEKHHSFQVLLQVPTYGTHTGMHSPANTSGPSKHANLEFFSAI